MSSRLDNITAIIPAAGRPTNKIIYNNNMPDTMLPINGKPVVGYIIEDLMERGIKKIIVILNSSDEHTEKYTSKKYSDRCELKILYDQSGGRGLGYAMYLGASQVKTEHILVYLGDTIYKGGLKFTKSFLVVANEYDDSSKWCFVESQGKKLSFIDKPQFYSGSGKIICGLYFFSKGNYFKNITNKLEKKYKIMHMHQLLHDYAQKDNFSLIKNDRWYDCGNIENYYQAKRDFTKLRGFNSLNYDDFFGILTKSGIRSEKIKAEINWYLNLPEELKIFTPRFLNHRLGKNKAQYSLEFYGYQSLDDIFIFGYLDDKIWLLIIRRLLEIVNLFKTYKCQVPFSDYQIMYGNKIQDRLSELKIKSEWEKLINCPEVFINGQTYKNVSYFLPKIKNIPKILYSPTEMGIVHGDLCLNNILFDPGNRLFKLIDPRGNFGKSIIYGDIKYDLAKLRFSLSGHYDFIVSDLFKVELKDINQINYNNYSEDYHHKIGTYLDKILIENGYDLQKIRMIEALLFLSVIPHHYDFPQRQIAMYATAIKLLNEVF